MPARGEYSIIQQSIRLLKHGAQGKQNLDAIVACSAVYDLKNELNIAQMRLENAQTTDQKNLTLYHNVMTVSRSVVLLCYASYLLESYSSKIIESGNHIKKSDPQSLFSHWMQFKHLAILKITKDWEKCSKYESVMRSFVVIDNDIDVTKSPTEAIIMNKNGNVLPSRMIIKSDDFARKANEILRNMIIKPINEQSKASIQLEVSHFRLLENVGACVAQAPLEMIKGILSEQLNISENDQDLIYGGDNCVVIDKMNKSLSDIATKQGIFWVYLPVLNEQYMKLDECTVGVSGKTIREVSQRLC